MKLTNEKKKDYTCRSLVLARYEKRFKIYIHKKVDLFIGDNF